MDFLSWKLQSHAEHRHRSRRSLHHGYASRVNLDLGGFVVTGTVFIPGAGGPGPEMGMQSTTERLHVIGILIPDSPSLNVYVDVRSPSVNTGTVVGKGTITQSCP